MNNKQLPDNTVFLIDGSSFLYRAYYSMRPLHTPQGAPVQAVYGFCRMIKKLIDTYQPQNMILIWDSKGKTARHELYPDYKATRQAPPSDLFEQKVIIREFAEKIKLYQLEMPGWEADDLIYSAAKELSEKNIPVAIVSSDKDLYQLLSDHVTIVDPFKEAIVTKELHEQALGYSVDKIPFYFSILGDASDNIPGVKGIGKKGAEDLVKQFASLEDLFERIDLVPKERTKAILLEHKDDAFLSKDLFLLRYTPLHLDAQFVFNKENWQHAFELFQQLNFKSLMADIQKKIPQEETQKVYFFEKKTINFITITHEEQLAQLVKELKQAPYFSLDTESTGLDPFAEKCVGISICLQPNVAYYIPFGHITLEPQLEPEVVTRHLKPILEDVSIKKILHHAKYDALVLHNMGISLQGIYFDTLIAANLVTPDWQRIGLDKLSVFYFNEEMLDFDDVVKKHKRKNFAHVPLNEATVYSGSDAHQTFALMPILHEELIKKNMLDLFFTIEMPLMCVLLAMEIEGIAINPTILHDLEQKITQELVTIEAKIKALIGEDTVINLNSPKQIEDLLFNKLLLPPLKKSDKRTGYSTDQSVLEVLSKLSPVPVLILRYRELTKLQTTYVQALPRSIAKDKKIHSSFSQISTATGRLASSNPNLQNIPADESVYTQQLRSAFTPSVITPSAPTPSVLTPSAITPAAPIEQQISIFAPRPAAMFLSADYSQIELRVLAFLSNDKNLLQAFLDKKDIHTITASKIFDISIDEVTAQQRQVGKRINFSILYGLTPYGLSQDLNISFSDAKNYIEKYFEQYPQVRTWMDSVVEFAKEHGYVETHWGRRRYIPGIYEKNKSLYEFAKRAAINTVAQGTAAEIMKIGMINVQNYINTNNAPAKIILQIHDELLIALDKDHSVALEKTFKEILERVVNWHVPLEVSTKIGHNWQEVS